MSRSDKSTVTVPCCYLNPPLFHFIQFVSASAQPMSQSTGKLVCLKASLYDLKTKWNSQQVSAVHKVSKVYQKVWS